MRSVKKGALSFGLVSAQVKLYAGTEEHDIQFHLHHGPSCLGGISQKRVCKECGEVVEYGDTIKGIERGDKTVYVTAEDFATLDEEQGPNFEVLSFADRDEIDPIMFEKTYFLDADKGAEEVYALIRTVLTESNRVGIVQFAYRQKSRMGVLRVYNGVLAIHEMRWHDEVRGTESLHGAAKEVKLNPKMVELAHAVIDSMTEEWDPTVYVDTYTEKLGEMVEAKAAGGEYVPDVVEEAPADVSDLLARLEASIAAKPKKKRPAKKAVASEVDAAVARHPAGRKRVSAKAS